MNSHYGYLMLELQLSQSMSPQQVRRLHRERLYAAQEAAARRERRHQLVRSVWERVRPSVDTRPARATAPCVDA
jgi:hypothetical protein